MDDDVSTVKEPYHNTARCLDSRCDWYITDKLLNHTNRLARQHCNTNKHIVRVEQVRRETHLPGEDNGR